MKFYEFLSFFYGRNTDKRNLKIFFFPPFELYFPKENGTNPSLLFNNLRVEALQDES